MKNSGRITGIETSEYTSESSRRTGMNFKQAYNQRKEMVEQKLLTYLEPLKNTKQETIYEAMSYSLKAGGKRFRPILHLETVKLLGKDPKEYLDSACALEYIHTYSLIHDDLPAMDNDDFRRGKPTNHKVFGEDIAILAGDGLLNAAYEILFRKMVNNPSRQMATGADLIAEKAGANGMVGGQVVDVQSEGKQIDLELLEYIHQNKTAALIEAAVLSAALMAGAGEEECNALKEYALNLGLAFQISDDILDVEGDFNALGKPIGSDAENHKTTFASYYGLEEAKIKLQEVVKKATTALDMFSDREFLVDMAEYMLLRKS